MTRKRQVVEGEYVRASPAEEMRTWVGQFALNNGIGLFQRKGGEKVDVVKAGREQWTGVVCGHWLVGPVSRWKRSRNNEHICISKCGVVAYYEPWYVSAGKLPQTCYACRPNTGETPSCRTLPEYLTKQLAPYFEESYMATYFEEQVQLKGTVTREWEKFGRPLMSQVCDTAGYGQHFGWKLYVHNCSEKPNAKSDKHKCRVRAIHKATRQIELMCQPAGCTWEFQYHLSTGRTDVDFMAIAERIKWSVGIVTGEGKEEKEEKAQVAAAATPEVNGHTGLIDLAALEKIGGNLQKLLAVGKDLNDVAREKVAAQEKLKAAQEKKNEAYAKMIAADEEMKRAKVAVTIQQDKCVELERKLRNEMAYRDQYANEHTAKAAVFDAARFEFEPLSEAVAAAEKELYDMERMEADITKTVGDEKKLKALLAALHALS